MFLFQSTQKIICNIFLTKLVTIWNSNSFCQPFIELLDRNYEMHAILSLKSDLEFDAPPEKQELLRIIFLLDFFFCYGVYFSILEHIYHCINDTLNICRGFNLPAFRVIHTVGPIYDVDGNPEASLRNAYRYIITLIASFVISLVYHSKQHLLFAYNGFRNSLILAKDNNIKYIAFPAISCGVYG